MQIYVLWRWLNKNTKKNINMKSLKAQLQLTPQKFVDNVCKMAKNGKNPDQQIALVDIIVFIKELVSREYEPEKRYDAMLHFTEQVEEILALYGLEFDQKVDIFEEKFVKGNPVVERDISISFSLVGVYFVFGWATNMPGIQMVYQQREKIYFAIH